MKRIIVEQYKHQIQQIMDVLCTYTGHDVKKLFTSPHLIRHVIRVFRSEGIPDEVTRQFVQIPRIKARRVPVPVPPKLPRLPLTEDQNALEIMKEVAAKHNVDLYVLIGSSRERYLMRPRSETAARLKEENYTLKRIANVLGRHCHTTVLYYLEQYDAAHSNEPQSDEPQVHEEAPCCPEGSSTLPLDAG